jgi:hypothetical protein
MTQLKDPAVEILKKLKPEKTEKDKEGNKKVKEEAKAERLKAWKRPSSDKERKDKKAERQADWEARR